MNLTALLAGNAKATIAAAVAFLGALQVGLNDGLEAQELVGAIIAGLVALGSVYGIKNAGQANAQDVVDAVKKLVPDDAKAAIEEVVPAARGILKTVT